MSSECVVCGEGTTSSVLCPHCLDLLKPCSGLLPEHIVSKTPIAVGAWLVDSWARIHPVSERGARIGRSLDHNLGVLHESVSREHAHLSRNGADWLVRDLGSKNGLLVGGELERGRAAIEHGTTLHIGSVPFFFLSGAVQLSPDISRALATATMTRGDIFRCSMKETEGPRTLQLIGVGRDLSAPGVLLLRSDEAGPRSELNLSSLEFALLRVLAVRAQAAARSGYHVSEAHISTSELARRLPFRSACADEENVRQAVRRLRRTLASLDIANLLTSTPGRGYRIAWLCSGSPEA